MSEPTTSPQPRPSGRLTLALMIPINLVLLPWIWFGRVVFGVGGWFILILTPVVLIVGVALLVTTLQAFTQPTRPRRLTAWERRWQWSVWLGLLVGGAFLPDFGDTEESYTSLLGRIAGRSDAANQTSLTIAMIGYGIAVVAWFGLVIALAVGRRSPGAAPGPAGGVRAAR